MNNPDISNSSEIAIVGLSGRFPGASNIDQFWANLCEGVESIAFHKDEELESFSLQALNSPRLHHVKAGGILENIEYFDASFFGFSPSEALVMDPQQRVFMECAWEALESSGYNPEDMRDVIGVFAGATTNTYLLQLYSNPEILASIGTKQIGVGNNPDFLALGVSYKLGLRGPSYTILTACSTSLVAVHVACQALLNFECDIALSGGISIRVPQKTGYQYQEGGILSPDGHCRAFDSDAQGTVFGNGGGVVVLRRLADAIINGDHIYAVIKGTAVNNDGSLKAGFTAPSFQGQTEVIVEALSNAEVDARTIGYVETHGTGTVLGDPIEIKSLTQAFRENTHDNGFCAIGSVKTNIGHLDAAAGISGLIKAVLLLKHKMFVPSLNFTAPNPQIDFTNSPFYVNTELKPWNSSKFPRRAGVSSFGIGGTNAHVILEESTTASLTSSTHRVQEILTLSAKTQTALESASQNLADCLKKHSELNLADVAYTLKIGRKNFENRRIIVCTDKEKAVKALTVPNSNSQLLETDICNGEYRPVVFMFPGQGVQHVNMARGIYETETVFKNEIDNCCQLLAEHLDFDLRKVLLPENEEQRQSSHEMLQQTEVVQPALFVIEHALARLLIAWSIKPAALIGHSLGEYVCACLAGVMTLEEALRLVSARAKIMQNLPGGRMLSIEISEDEILQYLDDRLSLAAVNNNRQCVVSGSVSAVMELQNKLSDNHVNYYPLQTSHAFHSKIMDNIADSLLKELKTISLKPPQIPYLSNLTGKWITAEESVNCSYWVKHSRYCVRFVDGVNRLLEETQPVFLEVGPKQVLTTLVRQQAAMVGKKTTVIPTFSNHPDLQFEGELQKAMARLWLSGVEIDWYEYYGKERRRRVPLPTYPFERQRYWAEPVQSLDKPIKEKIENRKKNNISDWFYVPSWKLMIPLLQVGKKFKFTEKFCWLLFTNDCPLGEKIVERLKEEGQTVTTVGISEQFFKQNNYEYAINPAEPADYKTLYENLSSLKIFPERILHLWTITEPNGRERKDQAGDLERNLGFYSLVNIAQVMDLYSNNTLRKEINVISTDLQQVFGYEQISPDKTMVLGPCKVIPQEYPQITCRNIDLIYSEITDKGITKLIEKVLAEIGGRAVNDLFEPVIAYREQQRWAQSFEPLPIGSFRAEEHHLPTQGVYLITGGLGRFGLAIAKYLAKTTQAKLILTGRSEFPERYQWDDWLASHPADNLTSIKIRKIIDLEKLGGEVLIIQADVSDQIRMFEVLDKIYEQFGHINGVIHAAGIVGEETHISIQESDREKCERIFQAKVKGVMVLNNILKDRHLDFCLTVSSLSPILGGLGLVAYASANFFMDAFSLKTGKSGKSFWKTVNWEGWSSQNINNGQGNLFTSLTELMMLDEEIEECFQRVLALDAFDQVVISTADLPQRIRQWVRFETDSRNSDARSQSRVPSSHLIDKNDETFALPKNEIEQRIAYIAQSVLKIEKIDIHDNFFEIGGTSLMAVQLISRLRETFDCPIPLKKFFENPTVAGLAVIVSEIDLESSAEIAQILSEVEGLSDEEVKARIIEEL